MRSLPRLLLATAAVLTTIPLAGCGGEKSPSRGSHHIVLWTQMDPGEQARFDKNLDAFRHAHPGVVIEYVPCDAENLRTRFQTAASSGGGPQILFGPPDLVGPLAALGLIKPLDTTMPPGFFERFVPQALDTLDGHLWQVPDQVGNHLMLVYNRALVTKPPETSAEFMRLARSLTRPAEGGRPAQYGFAMNLTDPYGLAPFLAGFGGWVMDDSGRPTLDSPAMVQALQFLRGLEDARIMPREGDSPVVDTLFEHGHAAMIIDGPWSWSGYRKAGIDVGVAPIFRLPNGQWPRPLTASKGYSINTNVKPADMPLVVDLVSYLTSPTAELRDAIALGTLPSHKQAYADSTLLADSTLQASRRAFELGRRMPGGPEMRVLWDVMRPGLQQVMNGSRTPAQAAKEMQAAALQQIAGMKP